MSFPRYDRYRDSAIEWVGTVPDHWTVQPLFVVASECDRPNLGMIENNLLSLSYGRVIRKNINENDGLLPESFETYQVVELDDIIWRLTDLQNDKRSLRTALVGERGIITSAYLATTPTGVAPRYLSYLLRAYDLQKVFYSMGGGLRQGMKFSDVKRLPILLPSEREQAAIAGFLDRETAKIDGLVEAQRRLVDLLKEKRQAVVSRAVTKGLDPSAPTDNSGVEWLGEVPRHWTVAPLKRFLSILSGYAFPSTGFSADPTDTRLLRGVNVGVGRVRWEDVVYWSRDEDDQLEGWELRAGDVVLGMDRPWIADGLRVARLSDADLPCLLLQRVTALRPTDRLLPDYLPFLLQGEAFFHHCVPEMTGVSVPHISPSQIGDFIVALPPSEEQANILACLVKMLNEAAELIEAAESAIELLQERRAALISAAVTGKIDVRGSSAEVRKAVAAEIVFVHRHKPTFGRVKNQKLIYLAEAHAGIHEIGGRYVREAAGPLDRNLIADLERELQVSGFMTVSQVGGLGTTVTYAVAPGQQRDRDRLEAMLGERLAALDQLNEKLADLDTHAAEAVATLYSVWNDFLLDGDAPTDTQITTAFLEDWHPEKSKKFKQGELEIWLAWMRRNGLVPHGRGPKTITDRLFP